MPPQPTRPEALEWQVFRGSDALRRRLLTPHQLRSKAWVHVLHDVYADARLARDHALKCRAALLRLPPAAVLAGPSAACLDGVGHAATYDDDVHVIVPAMVHIGPQRGVRVHATDLAVGDTTDRDGVLRTTPARTAWDVGAWLGVLDGVPIIDGLLHRGLLTPVDLARQVARCAAQHRRGSRRAQQAIRLADGRAGSPAESTLRVRLVLAGLPPPVPRSPRLVWPAYRVIVESDAESWEQGHPLPAGWLVVRVTGHHPYAGWDGVVRELRRALVGRGWRPARAVAA